MWVVLMWVGLGLILVLSILSGIGWSCIAYVRRNRPRDSDVYNHEHRLEHPFLFLFRVMDFISYEVPKDKAEMEIVVDALVIVAVAAISVLADRDEIDFHRIY